MTQSMAASEPRVAVIIPNYNGEEYLENCLTSLLDQTYSNYSITMVDNASADSSVELVRRQFPDVEIIENRDNTGFAGGCNAGLTRMLSDDSAAGEAEQRFKYFVLVNADVRAERDWLAELVSAAESDARIGLAQSLILIAGEGSQGRSGEGSRGEGGGRRRGDILINSAGNEAHYLGFGFCGYFREPDRGQFTRVMDVPFASGSSLLIRREVLAEVGLFDEDLFMYQEDLDLCWRSRLAGWRVVLAPASRIHHYYAFSRNPLKFHYLERNRLLVCFKCYGARSLVALAPAFIGAELAMLGYSLTGGWFRQKLRGYLYLLRNYEVLLDKRREVQSQRCLPDAKVASFWTSRMGFADLADSPLTRVANPVSALYWKVARRFI